MIPGMMDPEMIKLAQEQMNRMSPADLSRIQQQMMSNPDLMKLASESMKSMKPEDIRRAAEQLKSIQPDQMAEIGADAQINYQLNAAQMLKQKGNELHSQGMYNDALEKYLRAKNNLKGIPESKGGTLLLACSLNLMSCYLKTDQFDECIKEGIEVLETDGSNVKALYRRGQAYKSIGQLENAVSDLTKALEFSPDDETIADVLRDAKEKLTEQGVNDTPTGLKIEEITDEIPTSLSEAEKTSGTSVIPTNTEYLQALKDDKESIRSFQNFMSKADPETLASMEGISPDTVKTASNLISSMQPEEFQKMLEMATSFQQGNPNISSSNSGPGMPGVTPEMLSTATDIMNKMPPQEIQKMVKMASSVSEQSQTSESTGSRLNTDGPDLLERRENLTFNEDIGESSSASRRFLNSGNTSQSSFSSSSFDMQEQIKNQMKNPAVREMMSSMMKNISPDMMANMSEQFGYKLSREDAERAQQAMSSLSPESIDKMMKWADRAQRASEGARRTKNWLLGKQGLAMALILLIIAILLKWSGYIRH